MGNFVQQMLGTFLNNAKSNITPIQQNYIDTLKSGDSAKGEELATNLCKSMGVSREQAVAQARQFFHI